MRLPLRLTVAATLTTAALLAPLAGIVGARPGRAPDLGQVQDRCVRDLDRRTRPLLFAQAGAAYAPGLTDAHRSALGALVAADRAAVATTRAALLTTTTVDQLRAACRAALGNLGFVPIDVAKVALTVRADRGVAADSDLQARLTALGAVLDDLETSGVDVTAARAELASLQAGLDQLVTILDGLGDAIVGASVNDVAAALRDDAQVLDQTARARRELRTSVRRLEHRLDPPPPPDDGTGGGIN